MVDLLSALSPTSTSTSIEEDLISQTLHSYHPNNHNTSHDGRTVVQEGEMEDFDHQIAGHVSEKVRRYCQYFILKPQVKKELFRRESHFYEEVFSTPEQQQEQQGDEDGKRRSDKEKRRQQIIEGLRKCLPVFHGIVFIPNPTSPPTTTSTTSTSTSSGNLLPCLCLEDLTQGYTIPCLIDIKMGQQTYEPTASRDKMNREQGKYPYQHSIGFRITGLKVWDHSKACYHTLGKHFGRSLLPHEVIYGLVLFFYDGDTIRVDILQDILQALHEIKEVMKEQDCYHFYCSSLLVVYDSIRRTMTTDSRPHCRVKMIDFAHVVKTTEGEEEIGGEREGVDEGYLHGLDNLIQMLTLIVQRAENGNDEGEFHTLCQEYRHKFLDSSHA